MKNLQHIIVSLYACRYLCRMKILMVCLGNICRSPLAEGILRRKCENAALPWKTDSAGTGATYHLGEPPHKHSQYVAGLNDIDISSHAARQFVKEDITIFDVLYVMDKDNYRDVKKICGTLWDESKVKMLMNELYPGENMEVPDPWYGELDGYFDVYEMMDAACNKIVERAIHSSKIKTVKS